MANLSGLPVTLRDLARQLPDGLLGKLNQAEAEHRLRHVRDSLEAAEALLAEQYRHVTARSRKQLSAMPHADFTEEKRRLESLKTDARSAGQHDIADAWLEALGRLNDEHPQVPGVGEAITADMKAHPVSKAAKEAAKAARVQMQIDKAMAVYKAKTDELRREIEDFKKERGL